MNNSYSTWRRATVVALLALSLVACGDADDKSENNLATNVSTNNATTNNSTTNNSTTNNSTTNNTATGDIEVAGTWNTQFETTEVIDSEGWNGSEIIEFSNDENVAILQSPPDDEFSPNQFSRVVWTEPDMDVFYYCTVDFGLETLEEAQQSTSTADDTDPETGGCGGMFPWTKMTLAP